MADGTRMKSLEEQIRKQDARLTEMSDAFQRQLTEVQSKNCEFRAQMLANSRKTDSGVANLEAQFQSLLKLLKKEKIPVDEGTSMVDKTLILPSPDSSLKVYGEPTNREKWGKNLPNSQIHHAFHPKVELSFFDGNNPREWIRKCDKFFLVHQIEEGQKTDLVEMYLEGKADTWFQSFKMTRGRVALKEFSTMVVKRFEAKGVVDEIEEFNKLQQLGSVLEYQEKFESLRTLMLVKNPRLPKDYFISSFISGLKEELKPTVRMMKPGTIMEAFEIAVLQEQAIELSSKKFKVGTKWNGDPGGQSQKSNQN